MKRYEEYKDSGVQWLGEIPKHWEMRRLSQVSYEHFISNRDIHHQNLLSLSYGRIVRKDINTTDGLLPASFDTYQIVEEGNIVLRLTDLQNDHKSLRVGLVKEEGIITSAYLCLGTFNMAILPTYLYYTLHSYDIKKLFYSMGGGLRQNLNWQGLKKLDLPLPPLPEQRAIVAYIEEKTSSIYALVAEKEKQVQLLNELKEAEIANVITRGLNPEVKMKDSGIPWIGMIPEHWEVKKINSLFTERREKVSDTVYPPLSVSKIGITPQLDTAVKTDNGDNRKKVCAGDFVVNSRSDRKGSCGVSELTGSVSLINIVLKPRKDLEGKYFHYLFRSNNYIEEFYRIGRGIVADLWTTRYSEMRNISVPLPPLPEQRAIVAYIEDKCRKVDTLIGDLEAEIEYLKEYKQKLIADCVTGQVNVQGEL